MFPLCHLDRFPFVILANAGIQFLSCWIPVLTFKRHIVFYY